MHLQSDVGFKKIYHLVVIVGQDVLQARSSLNVIHFSMPAMLRHERPCGLRLYYVDVCFPELKRAKWCVKRKVHVVPRAIASNSVDSGGLPFHYTLEGVDEKREPVRFGARGTDGEGNVDRLWLVLDREREWLGKPRVVEVCYDLFCSIITHHSRDLVKFGLEGPVGNNISTRECERGDALVLDFMLEFLVESERKGNLLKGHALRIDREGADRFVSTHFVVVPHLHRDLALQGSPRKDHLELWVVVVHNVRCLQDLVTMSIGEDDLHEGIDFPEQIGLGEVGCLVHLELVDNVLRRRRSHAVVRVSAGLFGGLFVRSTRLGGNKLTPQKQSRLV